MAAVPCLPSDARLPQLARALDGEAMRQRFDAALSADAGSRVTACRVDRIKYRPGRNCTVSYRLEIRDERGEAFEQIAAGRFCAAGEAAPRHARQRPRVAQRTRCGLPAMLDAELELFAWFLPNDPRLPALPGLCTLVHEGGAALGEAASALRGETATDAAVHAELVQYVPEQRACARFALAGGAPAVLYAKLDREDAGADTQRLMQALYDSPAQREGRLATPRPLLWQPATGLAWQQGLPGRTLLDEHRLCPPPVAARVGRLIAALHCTPVALPRHLTGERLMARPRDCAAMLGRVEPRWLPVLRQILARLEERLAPMRGLPLATLHGDLHPRNLLIDGERLALIDLDSACNGAAVFDLGDWIADGLNRALLAGEGLGPVQDSAATLIEAYRAESGHPVNGGLLAWAIAHALLCQRAYRAVANLKPGRLALVPALLALAALIAETGDAERALPEPA